MNERDIFIAALQKEGAERQAYLDEACGTDTGLRQHVKGLLEVCDKAGRFLEAPPVGIRPTPEEREGPGTTIGPYRLLEEIGEGGFGVVFLAEQTQPVRRKVALKILKPGMDTRHVVARFEAERQALAIMDHANIAKVLDGGATPLGRPYFVMELVKGVPITEFCDQNHLTPRQRLELFIPVCQAVQHAHQKGIIHRDLKPSNILVVLHDTTPVPKVIDFGIAKAVGQELTDKTLFTGLAQMVGTPLYMSPEQAGQSGLDIDTRSDIYSLGVLLYELLTGTTPFDKERFKQESYDEIRRIIREEDPPKPSTRLSSAWSVPPRALSAGSAALNGRAASRSTLRSLRFYELDWIVMKCLEKERNRRYETASDLGLDVQRYLADEPVHACPPSAGYRLRKFIGRNRKAAGAVAAILLALVAGIIGTTWGLLRALAAENAARAEVIEKELARHEATRNWQTAEAHRRRAETNFREAVQTLEALTCPFDPDRSPRPVSVAELKRWQTERALHFFAPFCESQSEDPADRGQKGGAYVHTARVYQHLGEREKAQEALNKAITVYERLTEDYPAEATTHSGLASALVILAEELYYHGPVEKANACFSRAVNVFHRAIRTHPTKAELAHDLAYSLCCWYDPKLRDPASALALARKAVKLAPDLPRARMALGVAYYRLGKWKEAAQALQESVRDGEDSRKWPGTGALFFLAMAQWQCRDYEAARQSYQRAERRMDRRFSARDGTNRALRAEAIDVMRTPEPPTDDREKVVTPKR